MSDVQLDTQVRFDQLGKYPPTSAADRLTPIYQLAKGKKVLNVGCCGSDALTNRTPVHRIITNEATYCFGIDIFAEGIERFQRDGLLAEFGDAENFDLAEKDFDLAVVTELIEHVGNPGRVLKNCYDHLRPGGQIIVTTPNAFGINYFASNLLRNGYTVNSEHVVWFDPGLLSALLRRTGFEIDQLLWIGRSPRPLQRILQAILRKSFLSTFGIIASKPL